MKEERLRDFEELEADVMSMWERIGGLISHAEKLTQKEEGIETREVFMMLAKASASILNAAQQLKHAKNEIRHIYETRKDL